MRRCYYKILGLSHGAGQDEIKKAFRLLAFKWHPDKNREDQKAGGHFRMLVEAYETLVDPAARGRYDRVMGYEKQWRKNRPRSFYGEEDGSVSIDELLRECFGIHSRVSRVSRVYDLRFDLQVARQRLREGHYEEINYMRRILCGKCGGTHRSLKGATCAGCGGAGEVDERCTVRVWIPRGSEDGTRLRVAGGGDVIPEMGRWGDLVVVLHVVDM